jgi:hypothetical protein
VQRDGTPVVCTQDYIFYIPGALGPSMMAKAVDDKRAVTLAAVLDCYEKVDDASGGDARAEKMRPHAMLMCLQKKMPGFNERVLVQP